MASTKHNMMAILTTTDLYTRFKKINYMLYEFHLKKGLDKKSSPRISNLHAGLKLSFL